LIAYCVLLYRIVKRWDPVIIPMLKEKKIKVLKEYSKALIFAIIVALFIRAFFLQTVKIPSSSMEKTLLAGDFLFVNKIGYGIRIPFTDVRFPKFRDPEPGDIMVFKNPEDQSVYFIKRCIATAGQTVEIRDKVLFIDGRQYDNPPKAQFMYNLMPNGVPDPDIFPRGSNFNRDNYGPYTVPDDHLFMMGDNRDNSLDSRYWGPLPVKNIIGSAMIIYWSCDENTSGKNMLKKIRWSRIGDIIR